MWTVKNTSIDPYWETAKHALSYANSLRTQSGVEQNPGDPMAHCHLCCLEWGDWAGTRLTKLFPNRMDVCLGVSPLTQMSANAHSCPVLRLHKQECLARLSSNSDSKVSLQKVLFDTLVNTLLFSKSSHYLSCDLYKTSTYSLYIPPYLFPLWS